MFTIGNDATVELGDHQGGAMLAAELKGGSQGRTVIALSALDFQYLLHQGPILPVQKSGDSGPLRFES